MLKLKKGLSLIETMVSISIIALLVTVMVEIILFYNRLNRESSFLTTATLDAKEIGIKIERYMILARYIKIYKNSNYTRIICQNENFTNLADIYYIQSNPKYNQIVIYDTQKIEKRLSKEIYMVINSYDNINPVVYEVSFYVYNKYAEKYRNLKNKKHLAYYISIIKWKEVK